MMSNGIMLIFDREIEDGLFMSLLDFSRTRHYVRVGLDESIYGPDGSWFPDPEDVGKPDFRKAYCESKMMDDRMGRFLKGNIAELVPDEILRYSLPARGAPGLWCHWMPTKDRLGLDLENGQELNFALDVSWLKMVIDHFIVPSGRLLSGEVSSNEGVAMVENNVIAVKWL